MTDVGVSKVPTTFQYIRSSNFRRGERLCSGQYILKLEILVTTHNTQSENNDVDPAVVAHQPASDSSTLSSSGEQEGHAATQADIPVEHEQHQEEIPSASAGEPGTQATGQGEDVSSLLEEDEVRPFTAFIEEFRQTEARSVLPSADEFPVSGLAVPWEDVPPGAPFALFESGVTGDAMPAATEVNELPDAAGNSDTTSTAAPFEETQAAPAFAEPVADVIPETGEAFSDHLPVAPPTPTPAERPVSPLLRPASRLRIPRHGIGRHREEPPAGTPALPETQASIPAGESAPAVEEQPKPARRYRFDRPAPSFVTAQPPAQSRAEEQKDSANRSAAPHLPRTENGQGATTQPANPEATPAAQVSAPELGTAKQPATQETPAGDGETKNSAQSNTTPVPGKPAVPDHDRRRRHGQDRTRDKEQPQPLTPTASVEEAATRTPATTEPEPAAASKEKAEVNPEDLPPLEYAELQAANSRRRRRRRGNSVPAPVNALVPKTGTTDITPAMPTAPVPAATPAVPMPRIPGPVSTTPYNIVSGYTVSQMNQGTDGSGNGPFIGPDPSPARGSTMSREVRSIRAEVQRAPAYPARTSESAPSSASVHHLANVVAQAIQGQTDRMVAELRRASQGPTNISVSLPPFPSNERVGVFVDVANLLYSARTLRMTVDFGKLLDFLRGNRRLVRAQAYCPTSPQPGDEQMFLQAVKGLGYRITTKNYKTFSSGAKKADLDLDLCMDVVRLVDGRAVDCIVLVSGDSDFMPMLDYCSDHGVRVEVAAFDESMSATLRQSCDLFINLSMLEEIRA